MEGSLMYERLEYEEPAQVDRKSGDTPPLLNYQPMCEAILEDGSECPNPATSEFVMVDEEERAAGEGYLYITSRCAEHPEEDPDYHEREL